MNISRRLSIFILICAILTGWIYQFQLLSGTEVHWDEFYFLNKVHAHEAGRWKHTLQSIYVHFFGWLTWAGPNEVDQILWGRRFSFFVLASTMALSLFVGVRHLTQSITAALAATFLSLAHPFAAFQAFRFRVDPMLGAGFLAAGALLIVARDRRSTRLTVAVLLAFMGALSMKAIFFVPSLSILLLLPTEEEVSWRIRVRRLLEFGAVSGGTAVAFLGLHHLTLAEEGFSNSQVLATRAADAMFGKFLPRKGLLVETLQSDAVFWWPIGLGVLTAMGTMLRKDGDRRSALAVLAMCLPLSFPLFYRNSFSYFYVCIIPPACFAVGWLFHAVETAFQRGYLSRLRAAEWMAAAVALPLMVLVIRQAEREQPGTLAEQREFLAMVHRVFPEPVPYIDRCSMVASKQKVGPFLTTWRLNDLRASKSDMLRSLVRQEQPVFLVNNMNGLELDQPWKSVRTQSHRLPKADFLFLKKNYIQHTGPLWVAGKSLTASVSPSVFDIVVSGTYTVESQQPVQINDKLYSPDSTVELQQGLHRLQSGPEQTATSVRLRFGERLVRPELSNPDRTLFSRRYHPVRAK